MALRTRKTPDAGRALLAEELARSAGPLGGATRALTEMVPEQLEAPEALPVFAITPEQILDASYLETASLEGWSYTVFRGETPVAAAELAQGPADEEDVSFSHFTEGPFVEQTVTAVAQAEAFSEETGQDFEPRILRCPPIYLVAVWLHAVGRDVIIPMAPAPSPFVAARPYEKDEFDGPLIEAAKQSLADGALVNPVPWE